MTHHTDTDRAEFEAIVSDDGKWPKAIERHSDGSYRLMATAEGWMWWQAARRAPAVPVPQERLRVNPKAEPVPKYVYGEKEALLEVVALSVALEEAKKLIAASPVPQGWKPAPMEPTPEQLLKVYKQTGVSRKELADLWTAALAAAPQPPEAPLAPSIAVTPEMVEAANEAYCPFGDMELALWAALAAAPQPPEQGHTTFQTQGGEPVQLPEPVGVLRVFDEPHEGAGVACTEATINATNLSHGWHTLYTEQQVRQLLAAQERKPLTDEQVDDLHGEANRGFDIERDAYFKAFRDAERAHNIG